MTVQTCSKIIKTVVAMEDLLFKGLGANLFFEDESYLCQSEGVDPSIDLCISFALRVACVLDFY